MRFPTMWYVRPAKPQISLLYSQSNQSLCLSLEYSMSVKLLTEHHLEFLSLKGGCIGSFESTLVKIPHCWKSRVTAQLWAGSFYYMAYQVLMQLFAANIEDPARWQIPHLPPDPADMYLLF